MKQLFFIYFTALVLFVGGCSTAPQTSNEVEKIEMPKDQASKEPVKNITLDEITQVALNSECAKTAHDEQGKPPKGYLKGVSLSFARAVCNPNFKSSMIASQPVGDPAKDALAHYELNPATSQDRLETVYSLMLGSAARESSWRWCVGKDPGASNTSAETCEAGLYQTSYNSRSANAALPELFKTYKSDRQGCFAAEYKGLTTCSDANMKNWGFGDGVEFQKLSKECPGFATEYHSIMVRVARKHYGPINRKTTQIKPACVKMFTQIRKVIEAQPSLCSLM